MRTVKECIAAVVTLARDVAHHAATLGAHRAELNELRAEIAALKARGPAVRTPGQRVTEPCSPIDDEYDVDAALVDAQHRAAAAVATVNARRPAFDAERYPNRDKLGRAYRMQQINGRAVRCFAPGA